MPSFPVLRAGGSSISRFALLSIAQNRNQKDQECEHESYLRPPSSAAIINNDRAGASYANATSALGEPSRVTSDPFFDDTPVDGAALFTTMNHTTVRFHSPAPLKIETYKRLKCEKN
jgi:hypothetical protein